MADSAANDLAKYVATAFIGRKDAITDKECRGAAMIGNDAKGGGAGGFLFARLSSCRRR